MPSINNITIMVMLHGVKLSKQNSILYLIDNFQREHNFIIPYKNYISRLCHKIRLLLLSRVLNLDISFKLLPYILNTWLT